MTDEERTERLMKALKIQRKREALARLRVKVEEVFSSQEFQRAMVRKQCEGE